MAMVARPRLSSGTWARRYRRLPPHDPSATGHGRAAPDDGEALPVVAEWRRSLRAQDEAPHTLAWLGETERLLALEIQLIDDRQLTLPPGDTPWDEVRRDNELRLRQR